MQLLQYVDESPDPAVAALSTLMIGPTTIALLLGDRLVGLARTAGV